MPPRKRGPFHRAQIAPRIRLEQPPQGPLCRCGDSKGWHVADDGKGPCQYPACGCRRFRLKEAPEEGPDVVA